MAAEDWTITRAKNAGEKDNPHGGKLVKWYLNLEGPQGKRDDVYCQRKPGNDFSEGDKVYGRVEKGDYGWRLHVEQRDEARASGGGYQPDPDRDARIARQVAFKGAVEWVVAYPPQPNDASKARGNNTPEEIVSRVTELTEALLPIVTGEGPDVAKVVSDTAQALSTPPSERPNGAAPAPTKESLKQAFDEYIEREGPEAKQRVQLKLASLGITDYSDMDDDQAQEILKFLTDA